MAPLLLCILLGGCAGEPECEVSFLQTDRRLSQVKPWLGPVIDRLGEHLEVPDFFRHAAAPLPKAELSAGAVLGVGLGCLAFVFTILWAFTPNQSISGPAPQRWRLFMALMCLTMYLLNYADRYNISVAIIEISAEKGYDKKMQGLVQSAVYFGILPGTVTFGNLGSRDMLGPFNAMMFACIGWSLATILTPSCTDSSTGMLIFIRIALGFFEAGAAPCTYQLAVQWFPKVSSGHLLAAAVAGQCAGASIANAFGGVAEHDWRLVFYLFGSLGLLWSSVFALWGASTPEEHRLISAEELCAIEQTREVIVEDPKQVIAQSRLLGHPTVLSLMCAEACFAFLWYFWLSWMPSFFHDVYDLSTGDAGTLGMMIYWVGMPSPFMWSQVFSASYAKMGESALLSLRRTFTCITFLGASLMTLVILLTYRSISPIVATLLVMLPNLCLAAKVPGHNSIILDSGGSVNAARVGGCVHVASAISGAVSNLIVGYFLATAGLGYRAVFIFSIALGILGCGAVVQGADVTVIQKKYFDSSSG